MEKIIFISRQYNTDIEIIQCGTEKCKNGHFYGPAVRDFYLIHYVVCGKGFFQVGEKTYNLTKGGGFLIVPGQLTYYQADQKDPWEYIWVGFRGVKALELLELCALTQENPVFEDIGVGEIFKSMIDGYGMKNAQLHVLSKLYGFFAHACQNQKLPEEKSDLKKEYVSNAINFIKSNYMKDISIGLITKEIGLDRSYFYEIFKKQTGISPKQFLIDYRIEAACKLLRQTNYKISDIARSVGYEDEFMFSRMFSKRKGISPLKYRNAQE
ncbi:MAG: AraC family transcriptional regulator [Eubacteriales bacterium]|nr:AraC family transcriptional regulator [Eubacteriales bacterium]